MKEDDILAVFKWGSKIYITEPLYPNLRPEHQLSNGIREEFETEHERWCRLSHDLCDPIRGIRKPTIC